MPDSTPSLEDLRAYYAAGVLGNRLVALTDALIEANHHDPDVRLPMPDVYEYMHAASRILAAEIVAETQIRIATQQIR